MRTLALVVVAAACGGGGSKDPKAPEPAPAPAAAPAPEVGTTIQMNQQRPADAMPRGDMAESQPAPPAPPPAPPPPNALAILDRGHDKAGEVPGMPGWNVKRVDDSTVCGATRIVISKGKRKLDKDQMALAKVYGLVFPANLNFDPANKKKVEDSVKRFGEFVEKLKKTGDEATKHFEAQLASTDPAVKSAAATRIAQVSLQMASLLSRAPIPKDVRSGEFAEEKIDAYCDRMEEVSGPLAVRGQEALAACAQYAPPPGWYSALCTTAPE